MNKPFLLVAAALAIVLPSRLNAGPGCPTASGVRCIRYSSDLRQTTAMITTVGTVANSSGDSAAILALGGVLTSRLQNLQTGFNALLADPEIADAGKAAFLQQAYYDFSAVHAQLGSLFAMLQAAYPGDGNIAGLNGSLAANGDALAAAFNDANALYNPGGSSIVQFGPGCSPSAGC